MKIDITKPIEAVRKSDGKIVPVTYKGPYRPTYSNAGDEGSFTTVECPNTSETNIQWHADGSDYCGQNAWFVRNVDTELNELRAFKAQALARFPALAEPETDDEAADRFADEYYNTYNRSVTDTVAAAIAWARANPR